MTQKTKQNKTKTKQKKTNYRRDIFGILMTETNNFTLFSEKSKHVSIFGMWNSQDQRRPYWKCHNQSNRGGSRLKEEAKDSC